MSDEREIYALHRWREMCALGDLTDYDGFAVYLDRYRQEIDGRQVAPSEAAIDLPPADAWFVEWFNR